MNFNTRKLILAFLVVIGIYSCTKRDNYEEVSSDIDFSKNNSGHIYASKFPSAIDRKNTKLNISRYDIQQRKWFPLEGAEQCVSGQWDIKSSSMACVVKRKDGNDDYIIGIFKLPELKLINEVEVTKPSFPTSKKSQAYSALFKLSPDAKKIAVLRWHSNTPNQEYNGECFHIPAKYKISILSTLDSSIIFESAKYYRGETLDWSENSNGVYLSSFSDPQIFEQSENKKCTKNETKGISYDKNNIFAEDITYVDIAKGKSHKIVTAKSPKIFIANGNMYYSSWEKFYVWKLFKYDLKTGNAALLGKLSSVRAEAISPDGEWLLGNYTTDIPPERFSILINTKKLRDRRLFDNELKEYAVWTQ